MSKNPGRRFWQIHLSTAVVLMFAAGGLLWVNTRMVFEYATDTRAQYTFPFPYNTYGFPLPIWHTDTFQLWSSPHPIFNYNRLAIDIAFAVFALIATAILFEYYTRRRKIRV